MKTTSITRDKNNTKNKSQLLNKIFLSAMIIAGVFILRNYLDCWQEPEQVSEYIINQDTKTGDNSVIVNSNHVSVFISSSGFHNPCGDRSVTFGYETLNK